MRKLQPIEELALLTVGAIAALILVVAWWIQQEGVR